MAEQNSEEIGIAFGGEHRQRMTDQPQRHPGDPHLQTKPNGRRQRAIDDGHLTRRTSQQDRLGQSPVQRHLEPFDMPAHHSSAPPPNEKNDRKKLDAAKAIDSPKTI